MVNYVVQTIQEVRASVLVSQILVSYSFVNLRWWADVQTVDASFSR